MRSPTEKTLIFCKRMGWHPEVVERWIPVPRHPARGIRKDFMGVIDVICVKQGYANVAIQSTSFANHSTRVKKALDTEALKIWLSIEQNKLEVWSWGKREVATTSKKAKRATRTQLRLRIEQVYYNPEKDELYTQGFHDPDMSSVQPGVFEI